MQIKDQMRLSVETSVTDGFIDIITNQAPDAWRSAAIDINFLLLLKGAIRDLSTMQSVTLDIKQSTRTGSRLVTKTLPASALTAVASTDDWENGTSQHGTFSLSASEMNLVLDGNTEKKFWLLFSAIDLNGNVIVLGGTTLTVIESGIDLLDTTPSQGSNQIPIGTNYDGTGTYVFASQAGRTYEWTKGVNDTNIVNGVDTITGSSQFTAASATLTLHGTIGAQITAILRYPMFATLDQVIALMQGLLKTANPPGATLTLVSPNGLKARVLGVDDDGTFFNQPLDLA